LRGQGFVGRQDQRGSIQSLYDISDRKRFARPGDTQQRLVSKT